MTCVSTNNKTSTVEDLVTYKYVAKLESIQSFSTFADRIGPLRNYIDIMQQVIDDSLIQGFLFLYIRYQ